MHSQPTLTGTIVGNARVVSGIDVTGLTVGPAIGKTVAGTLSEPVDGTRRTCMRP